MATVRALGNAANNSYSSLDIVEVEYEDGVGYFHIFGIMMVLNQ